MRKIIFICICMTIIMGCIIPPRQPQMHTYEVLILPKDAEGKKCATECEKVLLMKKQTDELEYQSDVASMGRRQAGLFDIRRANRIVHEGEYKKCVKGCGASYETRQGFW